MAQSLTLYKLIVLYMLNNSDEALTNSQISDFILEREYTNYFHLQQSISELIDSKLIEVSSIRNSSYYRLTKQGKTTLSYFSNEISSAIKDEVKKFLLDTGYEKQQEVISTADYYENTSRDYSVRCQLKEHGNIMLEITLKVPTEEAAREACSQWKKKYQDIYSHLMEELI